MERERRETEKVGRIFQFFLLLPDESGPILEVYCATATGPNRAL